MDNDHYKLQQEIAELKVKIESLTILIEKHIQSENELLIAWNGFEWSKKVIIKLVGIVGGIVGIIWGIIQIMKFVK